MEKIKNKNYKLKLCQNYERKGLCDYGNNCNFAHGKNDLRKKKCDSYENCWNEDCKFEHPENWDPKKNKICKYYVNGFCKTGNNYKFNHIIEGTEENIEISINNNIQKTSDKKLDLNSNDIFPPLISQEDNKIVNTNYNEKDNINKSINILKKKEIIDDLELHRNKIENTDKDISLNIKFSINGKELNENELNEFLSIDKDNFQLEENIKNKDCSFFNSKKIDKINEKEIYENVVNDEKIMKNYGKTDDNLDILESNIDIMVKYFKEHSEIIKENLENQSTDNKLNFYNYYIENVMFLNKIIHDVKLFSFNCKILIKQERIKSNYIRYH